MTLTDEQKKAKQLENLQKAEFQNARREGTLPPFTAWWVSNLENIAQAKLNTLTPPIIPNVPKIQEATVDEEKARQARAWVMLWQTVDTRTWIVSWWVQPVAPIIPEQTEQEKLNTQKTQAEINKANAETALKETQLTDKSKDIAWAEAINKIAQQNQQIQFQEQKDRMLEQYDTKIEETKSDLWNLAHNLNFMRGQLWLAPSTKALEAQRAQLDRWKALLEQIRNFKGKDISSLTKNYEDALKVAEIKRKTTYDEWMRKLLDNMSIQQISWALDTKDWIKKFRDQIREFLTSDEQLSQQQVDRYKLAIDILDRDIKTAQDTETKRNTVNDKMSTTKGYYVNELWEPIKWEDWKPIKVEWDITTQIIKDDTTGSAFVLSFDKKGNITKTTKIEGVTSPKKDKIAEVQGSQNWVFWTIIKYGDWTQEFIPSEEVIWATWWFTWQPWVMRTDRHNNPTAFTTELAKQAWLIEWVDYVKWDSFPNNPNLFTAKLLWDPIEKTIKLIDTIWFYTWKWQQRWTHTAMPKQQWDSLDYNWKRNIISSMYQKEGGSWELVWTWATKQYTPWQETLMNSIDPAKLTAEDKKTLRQNWLNTQDLFSFKSQEKPMLTPEKKTVIKDVLTWIADLRESPWKSWAVWFWFQKYLVPWFLTPWEWDFLPWTWAANFSSRFSTFKDTLALPSLDKMKWAMSDKDIQFLRNTATALSLDMSEEEFDKTLNSLEKKYNEILWKATIVDEYSEERWQLRSWEILVRDKEGSIWAIPQSELNDNYEPL